MVHSPALFHLRPDFVPPAPRRWNAQLASYQHTHAHSPVSTGPVPVERTTGQLPTRHTRTRRFHRPRAGGTHNWPATNTPHATLAVSTGPVPVERTTGQLPTRHTRHSPFPPAPRRWNAQLASYSAPSPWRPDVGFPQSIHARRCQLIPNASRSS